MNQPNIAVAQALGAKAFSAGIHASCLDPEMMAMFDARPVGDPQTIPELKAWVKGHALAMLAAPVVFED